MRRRHLLALPPLLAAPRLRAESRLPVVASFSILGDMTAEIGRDRLALRVIVGPETDAHVFQPRPSHSEALRQARLVVRNGLGFEPWLDRLLRAAGYRGPVATATEGITPRLMAADHHHGHRHSHGHDHGQAHQEGAGRSRAGGGSPRRIPDPHAWQDLRFGRIYVRNIAAALAAADPQGAAFYARNADAYEARLAALDEWVKREIATIPPDRRRVVISHDAFGYFAEAYGITFLSPQGISTAAEASAAEVARLIRFIREHNITALFLENMANPAILRRIAAETGIVIGGKLYSDALSAPDGPAPTYEAMFRHNVGVLVAAMRGRG